MTHSEEYMAGYRAGFEAGRMAGPVAPARPLWRPTPTPRRVTPKCDCGHSASSHNDLGYCQRGGKGGAYQCDCPSFENDQTRAELAEYRARRASQ